jgi:type I restriction enzyme M protein
LINASSFWQKMRKSLGSKRKAMSEGQIADVTRLFGSFVAADLAIVLNSDGKEVARAIVPSGDQSPTAPEGGKVKVTPLSRIFANKSFGYRTITVERPLRDEFGKPVLGQRGRAKGKVQPDSSLRDTENVPLHEDVEAFVEREVKPHAPDSWIDHEKTKIGYEIPFNRHFYVFEPPRPLAEIDADLREATGQIRAMLQELAA